MACSVCWRPAASARPRVSSRNRSSSSPAISAGRSAATRAAASSIASGIPSSRRQISPTAATLDGVSEKSPRAAAARWANRDTASLPRDGRHARIRGRQRQRPQPEDLLPAHAQRLLAGGQDAHPRAAAQDVRGQRRRRGRQVLAVVQHQQQRARGSARTPPRCRPWTGQAAGAPAARPRRPAPSSPRLRPRCSSHSHAPSQKDGSWSAAACSASRVLPTPPGPVTVTSGDRAIAAASPASSPARPTNELSCTGRFPANASSVRSGGNSAAQPGPGQLEDPHRPGQIPQPVLPQVHQRAPLRQVITHQQLGGPRHQHLPAMPGRHQPGAPVQRLVQVMLPAQHPLIGQQPHPRRQRPGHLPPVLRAQLPLRRQHRADRIPGRARTPRPSRRPSWRAPRR